MSGSGERDPILDQLLEEYRRQVLRWNRQINLISRQESPDRLEGLIQQCREAWDHLASSEEAGWPAASGLWYFDLGSGAGLPGFVWHAQAARAGQKIRTWLVEPREKRAWFLDRLNHLEKTEPMTVVAGRWGEVEIETPASESPPSHILISLKALHLTDTEVLDGLAPWLPGQAESSLLLARFYPPEQRWSQELEEELEILPSGAERTRGGRVFRSKGGRVLAPGSSRGASLVLVEYLVESR